MRRPTLLWKLRRGGRGEAEARENNGRDEDGNDRKEMDGGAGE